MLSLTVRKGHSLRLHSLPSAPVITHQHPKTVACLPARLPHVKARLQVKQGQSIACGAPLFEDKRLPNVVYAAPGGGQITQIQMGPRRIIEAIVIVLDADEPKAPIDPVTEDKLSEIDCETLVERMCATGLWPFVRALPYCKVADPARKPDAIIVNLDSADPTRPAAEIYLKNRQEHLDFGLALLKKLAAEALWVSLIRTSPAFGLEGVKAQVNLTCEGPYPAGEPAVLAYHLRKKGKIRGSNIWYVNGQDLLGIARSFLEGAYAVDRVVRITGNDKLKAAHVRSRLGAPLSALLPPDSRSNPVYPLVGGLLQGYCQPPEGYLGLYETSVSLVDVNPQPEFLGFARPGLKKASRSRTFLSVFSTAPLPLDGNQHGELRACVNCSYCARVCPVDMLPQFTYKAILAEAVGEYLAHGLLDCAECGLCSYVCPSKIDLMGHIQRAKTTHLKEQGPENG